MKSTTLHQARLGFKFANQTENKSPHTIKSYDSALDRLEMFFLARSLEGQAPADPLLPNVSTEELRECIASLQGKTSIYENHKYREPVQRALSPVTIRDVVVSLSAFFNWAAREGLLPRNPMDTIRKPKVPKVIKERFSMEDVEQLIEACKLYPESLAVRNRAIVLFLLDTGVRAAELCTLTLDHLDLEHGRAHVTGKGMKDRDVFMGKVTRKALWSYVVVHRPVHSDSRFVFLTHSGGALSSDRLRKVLSDLGERAGVAHVHPHRFRHTAARLFIRNGGDAFALQRLLGHEGLETTRRYVELEREDVEKAHERASPVDRWGLK